MAKQVDFEVRVIEADKAVREFERIEDSIDGVSDSVGTDFVPSMKEAKKAIEQTASPTKELSVFLPLLKTNFLAISSSIIMTGGIVWAIAELIKTFNTLKLTQDDVAASSAALQLEMLHVNSSAEEYLKTIGQINKELRAMTNEQLMQKKMTIEDRTTKYLLGFHGESLLGGESKEAKQYKADLELLKQITEQLERRLIPDINNEANAYERLLRQQEGLTLILHQTVAGTKEQTKAKKDLAEVEKLLATYDNKKIKDKDKFIDKETVIYLTQLNDAYKDYLDIVTDVDKRTEHIASVLNNAGTKRGMTFGAGGQLAALLGRGVNPSDLAQMEEKYKVEQDWIQRNADFFQSEFNTAWETVLGKANSLFERYLAMWADQFASNLFNMKKGQSFLDLIPGFGFLSDLFSSSDRPSSGGGSVVKLYVDGKEFAQATVNANAKANKLRLVAQ